MIAFICTEKVLDCGVGVELDPISFHLVIIHYCVQTGFFIIFAARCFSDCEEVCRTHWLRAQ